MVHLVPPGEPFFLTSSSLLFSGALQCLRFVPRLWWATWC